MAAFIHIFFHLAGPLKLRVQGDHVNLKKQKVRYLLLKSQQYEWVERTIKDIALPLWEKSMENSSRDQEWILLFLEIKSLKH